MFKCFILHLKLHYFPGEEPGIPFLNIPQAPAVLHSLTFNPPGAYGCAQTSSLKSVVLISFDTSAVLLLVWFLSVTSCSLCPHRSPPSHSSLTGSVLRTRQGNNILLIKCFMFQWKWNQSESVRMWGQVCSWSGGNVFSTCSLMLAYLVFFRMFHAGFLLFKFYFTGCVFFIIWHHVCHILVDITFVLEPEINIII